MKADENEILSSYSSIAAQEVRYKGYSVIEDVLSPEVITQATEKIDKIQSIQIQEAGRENIYDMNEENLVRLPMSYDDFFVWQFLNNALIKNTVSELLGSYHQLHSQNAILIHSHSGQRFSSWHRDFTNFNFDTTKCSAVTALYCLQELTSYSGGPVLLPFSHKMDKLPTADYIRHNQVAINAKAGSLILMDSMLYHHASANNSHDARRSIKHIFTNPLMKQEINIPVALNGKFATDPYFSMVLGYNHNVPGSVKELREKKIKKYRKQG